MLLYTFCRKLITHDIYFALTHVILYINCESFFFSDAMHAYGVVSAECARFVSESEFQNALN